MKTTTMFQKAVRRQAVLKLAITGPSGSGKTYSALRLASGMGKKIAVLDTENGSASLYSDKFNFDVVTMEPPFATEKYQQVINAAEKAGYDVLIIDSITHAWAGEGGLLEQKEQLDSRGKGNSYTNWATITKRQEAFKSAILHSSIHILTTMRSKQDYVQGEENGRKTIKKVGLAPIQREGMEYEFTIVFDIGMNHETEVSKDRTGLFAGKIFKITEDTGKTLLGWLNSAEQTLPPKTGEAGVRSSPPAEPQKPDSPLQQIQKIRAAKPKEDDLVTFEELKNLQQVGERVGCDGNEIKAVCEKEFGVKINKITHGQFLKLKMHFQLSKDHKSDFAQPGDAVDPAAMQIPF